MGFTNRFTGAKMTRTDMTTGQTLAHEMGHSMGLGHDFWKTWRGRKQSCGPGKFTPGGALMNYGVRGETWSKCSVEDFKNYYIQQTREKAFCLKISSSCGTPGEMGKPRPECGARKLLKPCFQIRDRETCLKAFDTRAKWKGPCGWCGGEHCPKSKHACQPKKWLLQRKLVVGIHYEDCLKKGKVQQGGGV